MWIDKSSVIPDAAISKLTPEICQENRKEITNIEQDFTFTTDKLSVLNLKLTSINATSMAITQVLVNSVNFQLMNLKNESNAT